LQLLLLLVGLFDSLHFRQTRSFPSRMKFLFLHALCFHPRIPLYCPSPSVLSRLYFPSRLYFLSRLYFPTFPSLSGLLLVGRQDIQACLFTSCSVLSLHRRCRLLLFFLSLQLLSFLLRFL
jgi:hypothetical protein